MTLNVISVRTERVLDTVTLVDGKLRFTTGASREVFDGLRAFDRSLSDSDLMQMRSGWSNGYVQVKATTRATAQRRFNPDEPRIPGGPHGGEWGHPGGLVHDALKLAGRIDLAPGESLVSSRQLDFGQGAAKLATTNHGVRLGLGGNAFASDPWRAANKGLTVKLSSQQARDVADGLDHALKQAKAGQAAADRLWEAADAAQGTAGHAALLKKAQDAVMGFAQPSGTVPGQWGTVHIGYSVTDTEPAVWAAVRPTNAPADWDLETAVDEDAGLRMDPAEVAKLARTLRTVGG